MAKMYKNRGFFDVQWAWSPIENLFDPPFTDPAVIMVDFISLNLIYPINPITMKNCGSIINRLYCFNIGVYVFKLVENKESLMIDLTS